MDKTAKAHMTAMKRNTENSFYVALRDYLKARQRELNSEWTKIDVADFKQLQGRKLEIDSMLQELTRNPVKVQHLDSYGD